MYHEYMLQWYEQNPLWEIYKDYTTTKAVITTPKAEKMNLVQSHRLLEVHRPLTLFDEVGHVTIWRSEYVHSQK